MTIPSCSRCIHMRPYTFRGATRETCHSPQMARMGRAGTTCVFERDDMLESGRTEPKCGPEAKNFVGDT